MNFKELGANLGLEEDEYRELVELFMTSGVSDFKNLISALAAADADSVMRYAHAIKGASGNLGLNEIYETAGIIEKQAGHQQLADLAPVVETLQSQFDVLQNFVGQ